MARQLSYDPTNSLLSVGICIGYKSIVKLKFCAQPMHQIYVIKYYILLVHQNKNEFPGTCLAFHNNSLQV